MTETGYNTSMIQYLLSKIATCEPVMSTMQSMLSLQLVRLVVIWRWWGGGINWYVTAAMRPGTDDATDTTTSTTATKDPSPGRSHHITDRLTPMHLMMSGDGWPGRLVGMSPFSTTQCAGALVNHHWIGKIVRWTGVQLSSSGDTTILSCALCRARLVCVTSVSMQASSPTALLHTTPSTLCVHLTHLVPPSPINSNSSFIIIPSSKCISGGGGCPWGVISSSTHFSNP